MVKIKQNINKHSITVVSNNRNASVLASTDSTMYYSNLSKEWACKMPTSVDGTEYSARYYMEKTKQEAIDSKADLQVSCSQNISDMNDIKDNAVASLQALCSQNISDMNDIKDNAVADLQAAGDDILDSVSEVYVRTAAIETELLNLVPTLADVSLSNINNTAKIQMANASMPSNTSKTITLGASGATYTAPADGWFGCTISVTAGSFNMTNTSVGSGAFGTMFNANAGIVKAILPVKKGDEMILQYVAPATQTYKTLRFIYAVGSESEAL